MEPSASKEENPARPVLKLAVIGSPVGGDGRTETKYAAARNLSRRLSRWLSRWLSRPPSRQPRRRLSRRLSRWLSRRLSRRLSRWLSRRLSQGQVCISNNYLISGAPNGSVPQNICSSRKIFAGWEIWKINMSLEVALEGTCCWEIDMSGCLRGFVVQNSSYLLFVINLYPLPLKGWISPLVHTQILSI